MPLSKKGEELLAIGKALDNGIIAMPEEIFNAYVERYHELQKIVYGEKGRE